jgi:hypothetical protein
MTEINATPQPETAEQHRAPWHDDIADAIIVSDRVAGCDPEALRAEAADLRGALKLAKDGCQTGYTMAATYRAERDALAARLAVVTEALAPFGEFSRVLHHNDRRQVPDDAVEAQSFGDDVATLTRGDFRAAVAALTDNPARAAAMLDGVKALRLAKEYFDRVEGQGEGGISDFDVAAGAVSSALRALDGEARHD